MYDEILIEHVSFISFILMLSLTCGINDIFTDNMFQDLITIEQSSFFWGAPFNFFKNMLKSILQVIIKIKNKIKTKNNLK